VREEMCEGIEICEGRDVQGRRAAMGKGRDGQGRDGQGCRDV